MPTACAKIATMQRAGPRRRIIASTQTVPYMRREFVKIVISVSTIRTSAKPDVKLKCFSNKRLLDRKLCFGKKNREKGEDLPPLPVLRKQRQLRNKSRIDPTIAFRKSF
jgi:hypothetical protein